MSFDISAQYPTNTAICLNVNNVVNSSFRCQLFLLICFVINGGLKYFFIKSITYILGLDFALVAPLLYKNIKITQSCSFFSKRQYPK